MLAPWKKSYDKTKQHIKKWRYYLPTKIHIVKAMVSPVVMYGCESWNIKKAKCQRIDAFKQWSWRLLRVPWIARRSSQSILKEINPELAMPSKHLILCCPLLLLPSIFPSIRVFSNESAFCIKWPKYWSFSFSISPSYEYSGLISFRIDWFDLLEVQGTVD